MKAFDELRALGIASTAQAIGLSKVGRRGYGPCPQCGAVTRHRKRKDKRGAIGVTLDGHGWACFQCDARGDAARLVSHAIGLHGRTSGADARRVLEAARNWGLIGEHPRQVLAVRREATETSGTYPPADEIASLLRACHALGTPGTEAAEAWARSRGLEPDAVAELCAVTVLSTDAKLPTWARTGMRSWRDSGHRLVVPLYDAHGVVRSVRARDITSHARIKELTPSGHTVTALVMADRKAYRLLKDDTYDVDETMAVHVRRVGVVVAEGTPDWLTAQLAGVTQRGADAPAVFGIFSGAWTPEHAAKVPRGTPILIATDRDNQGEAYAANIASTFSGRCPCRRWQPKSRNA